VLLYLEDNLDDWKLAKKEILLNVFNNEEAEVPGGILDEDIALFISNPLSIPTKIKAIL
jgi:hypothetical protein